MYLDDTVWSTSSNRGGFLAKLDYPSTTKLPSINDHASPKEDPKYEEWLKKHKD